MGSYVFEENQYKRFVVEWARALSEKGQGIKYFHAKEYAHLRGEFKRVGFQRKDADELYRYLITLIRRRARFGVAVSAVESDFQAVKPQWATYSFYSFLAQSVAGGIHNWAESRKFSGRIAYFLEGGHKDQNEVTRGLNVLREFPVLRSSSRYLSHTLGSKADFCGLQAADILAYEWFKDRKNQIEGSPRARRRSLLALGEGKPSRPHTLQSRGHDCPFQASARPEKSNHGRNR